MRNNKLFSKTKSLLFILLLSCIFIGQNSFAEGDGSGGGNSDPLSLVSSSISNGATGVSLKPVIILTFSKNIVNMSVNVNNKTCFTLQSGSGTSIPIEILFADDQIDREKRNDATITPKANLAPGTSYTLVVSSALKSKSGVTMENDVKIPFTTEGKQQITNPNNSLPAPNPEVTAPNTVTPSDKANSTTNNNSNSNKITQNTIPNDEEKSSTEQDVDTQTEDDTPTEEKLVEDEPQTSDEDIVKASPYAALESTNKKADLDKPQAEPNSTLIVAFVIVLIAAASVYLVKRRKKRAK